MLEQIKPLSITIGKNKPTEAKIEEMSTNNYPNNGSTGYWIEFNKPRLLYYVRLSRYDPRNGSIMTICEVRMYDAGTYFL